MNISQIPNLRVEDFSSEQSWIGRLFVILNPFIQSVNQVVNGQIDYNSNIAAVTRSFTVTTTFAPINFQWTFGGMPASLDVIKATKSGSQTPTILAAAWSYDIASKTVTITRMVELLPTGVAELTGSYQFNIRVTV